MLNLTRIVASHAVAKRQTPQGIQKIDGKFVVDLEDAGGFVTRLLLTKAEAAQLPVDATLKITLEVVEKAQPAERRPDRGRHEAGRRSPAPSTARAAGALATQSAAGTAGAAGATDDAATAAASATKPPIELARRSHHGKKK
ncbi:MAG: hypothetical protein ACYCT1_08430 [Steroidobacteraceae bacterium]